MARRVRIHLPGLIYALTTLMVALAAMNTQNNLLFWWLGVMVSVYVLAAVVARVTLRGLSIRRLDAQHGAVGEPLIVRYAVRNHRRFLPGFNLFIEDDPGREAAGWRRLMRPARAWIMHVGPRETAHGEAVFWPTARGDIAFSQLRAWTTFPFGLVRRRISIRQEQHTPVYPMLYELRSHVLSALTPGGLIGMKVSQHPGSGEEYYGMREYRPGDPMRHIAWKRTARVDELVTIERTRPSPAKLRIVLDLTTPTSELKVTSDVTGSARDLEERAISLAASLVHAADALGLEVGLTVFGTSAPPIAIRRNAWHRRKIMAALAAINLDEARTSAPHLIREPQRAGLIVVAPDRVTPLHGRDDAWYLSARQLDSLVVGPLGWHPSRPMPMSMVARQTAEGAAA